MNKNDSTTTNLEEVSTISTSSTKRKEKKKISKKTWLIIIGVIIILSIIGNIMNSVGFDVELRATEEKGDAGYIFNIETNLPDETKLNCTLYKNSEKIEEQNVEINSGAATTAEFTNSNKGFDGTYTLKVVCLPSAQKENENVTYTIGEKGENMHGELVKTDNGVSRIEADFDFELKMAPKEATAEDARAMAVNYYAQIDWDKVFKWGADVHYVMKTQVRKVNNSKGVWEVKADAELKNGFGAEFSSYVYIYLDKDLNFSSCYYDDIDGNPVEIPWN